METYLTLLNTDAQKGLPQRKDTYWVKKRVEAAVSDPTINSKTDPDTGTGPTPDPEFITMTVISLFLFRLF